MTDMYSSHTPGLTSPPVGIVAVIPDDGADLPQATRALNVSGTGHVRVTTVSGTTETVFVAAGIVFPVRATRIWASGTDAAGIKGLY